MCAILRIINRVKRFAFYVLLISILIVFFINQILGIIFSGVSFLAFLVSYLVSHSSKRRLLRRIGDYSIITDKEIATKFNLPLDDIKNILFSLSKNQKKKKWLIVFLNNRYIFLNEQAVKNFELLYYKGYNEKKIFESLQNKMRIKSRAEVKAIVTTMTNENRLTNIGK
ncbi:MAG: hypothetical protein EU547_03240 [Promethearchaeota archaeon]|nr:MAG: hypothetical protein EU547_03240 [Candidatus Lokiarchaeota archaeon]